MEIEVTDEQRRAMREIRELPDPIFAEFLRSLHADWLRLFFLPIGPSRHLDCKLPQNHHSRTVRKYYQCQNNASHEFCYAHDLANDKCPICGHDVDTVP